MDRKNRITTAVIALLLIWIAALVVFFFLCRRNRGKRAANCPKDRPRPGRSAASIARGHDPDSDPDPDDFCPAHGYKYKTCGPATQKEASCNDCPGGGSHNAYWGCDADGVCNCCCVSGERWDCPYPDKSGCKDDCAPAKCKIPEGPFPQLPSCLNPGAPLPVLDSVGGKIFRDPSVGGYVTYMPKDMIDIADTDTYLGDAMFKCITKGYGNKNAQCHTYKNVKKGSKNHGSSLAVLPDGSVMATWFSGLCEGYAKVTIQYSMLKPQSPRWSKNQNIPDNQISDRSNQNSVLHYDNYAKKLK